MTMGTLKKVVSAYQSTGQRIGATFAALASGKQQALLLALGVGLLALGTARAASAQLGGGLEGVDENFHYNTTRICAATNIILSYIEGSFGALVMVCAGLGAILASAFGQYKASLGALIVAVGSFILRSVMGTFFNYDEGCMGGGQ